MNVLLDFKHIIQLNKNDNVLILIDKAKQLYNVNDILLYKNNKLLNINRTLRNNDILNYSNITSLIPLNGGATNNIFPNITNVLLVSILTSGFVVIHAIILLLLVVLIINKSFRNVTTLCINTPSKLYELQKDGFRIPLNIFSNLNIRFNCIENGFFQLMGALDITKSPLLLLYGSASIYFISIWTSSLSILVTRQLNVGPKCESLSTIMILVGLYFVSIFFILFMSMLQVPFIQEYSVFFISLFFIIISIIISIILKKIINRYHNTEYDKINPFNDLLSVPFFTTLTFIILFTFFWIIRFNRQFMLLFILSIGLFISYLIPMVFAYISNTNIFAISPCWE